MFFETWRDRYGWVIGALILMAALAVMAAQYFSARPPRILHLAGLAFGLAIGGLFFVPAVPRLVTALQQLFIARAPMDTSGPFPVATADIALPTAAAGDPTILVQIWYPTAGSPSAASKPPESTVPPLCSKVLDQSRLAGAEQKFSLLL